MLFKKIVNVFYNDENTLNGIIKKAKTKNKNFKKGSEILKNIIFFLKKIIIIFCFCFLNL
jgi:hypothetical protein